ncbi:MAG: hypothetical protein WD355_02530 [Balneolaceae bacterium]
MNLKKFFGTTIDEAKQRARQRYGNDFVILETVPPVADRSAAITVVIDHPDDNRPGTRFDTEEEGVRFERSRNGDGRRQHKGKPSSNLNALRNYVNELETVNGHAERNGNGSMNDKGTYHGNSTITGYPSDKEFSTRNTNDEIPIPSYGDEKHSKDPIPERKNGDSQDSEKNHWPEKTPFIPGNNPSGSNGKNNNGYSRASVRKNGLPKKSDSSENEEKLKGTSDSFQLPGSNLLSRFDESKPHIGGVGEEVTPSAQRREQREITALHKRFDKLEALLDSAFISSNLDYVSHPAFQQLVRTGISTSVVSKWFGDIIKHGIDPFEHTEAFMGKLSAILRRAISGTKLAETEKYMLFTGPSGSGKTELIMKLILHPEFLSGKKLSVVSLLPPEDENGYYYTILEPFCKDQNIPFFKVRSGDEITQMQKIWSHSDHVLIDTPSVKTGQEHSFREYWKIRQAVSTLSPLEVHYVINASNNRFYFEDSSAVEHPLKPDYVAITHLDEVSKWGPLIPVLQQMEGSARYISKGDTIPNSLDEFDPSWFAKHVLKEN